MAVVDMFSDDRSVTFRICDVDSVGRSTYRTKIIPFRRDLLDLARSQVPSEEPGRHKVQSFPIPQLGVTGIFRTTYSDAPHGWKEYTHGPDYVDSMPPGVQLLAGNVANEVLVTFSEIKKEIDRQIRLGRVSLYDLPPRRFEEYVASLFESHGYSVELTAETHDGGYDVIAIRHNPLDLDLRVLVECKRYAPDRPVDISIVRQLWGVINTPENQFDRGMICTTSRLSQDAERAIRTSYWRLKGMDHQAIMEFAGFRLSSNGLWVPASQS